MQDLAKKAAETVVLVVDEEGIDSLISELIKSSGDSKVHSASTEFLLVQPSVCFSCK